VLEGVGQGGSVRQLFLVFLGSGLGGGARYLLGGWLIDNLGVAFPFATVAINAIGSFLIGLIMHLSLNTALISSDLRLTLTTGVLGGFTTYSTFNYETISLFQQGAALLGALNLLVTVILCLIAGAAGLLLGRWWVPA
jgi:fluoride exporter